MDWAGPALDLEHSENALSSTSCHGNNDLHCSDSQDNSCPGDDCQDCHCCHNHFRYLIQNTISTLSIPQLDVLSSQFTYLIYEQPVLDPNIKPPKHA